MPLKANIPALLTGKEQPADIPTLRALAKWHYKYQHRPATAARIFVAVFAKQPSLADDLESQDRQQAAYSAALAGCGLGDDTANLDDAAKALLRKQALVWLKADCDAWTKRHKDGKALDQIIAAKAMGEWKKIDDLGGVRDQACLSKLPEQERREWEKLWADVHALALRDPSMSLEEARAHVLRKQWVQAVAIYRHLLTETPTSNGEVWFEFAAVQLLSGDRQRYRDTCKRMLEGAPKAPKMRPYLLARACTLAPDSVEDAALPALVSTPELERPAKTFWSLTEQGALRYRAKRYREAVPFLEQSLQMDARPSVAVLNWLWLAMASHQLGEKDESRRWFNKASAWLDSLDNGTPGNAVGMHRHDLLEAHVLRREAEMLLWSSPER